MLNIDGVYGAWPVPQGFSLRSKETVMADNKIQGEGDYISGKKYQDMQHEFAEKGPVEQKAREAEQALDGREGEALEEARKDTGAGKTH